MTKEQYEAAVITLQAKYKCDSDYYQGLVDVNSEYIASLEAEAKLLDAALHSLSELECPPESISKTCQLMSDKCSACWREHLLREVE